jgi:two-component system sensor histidine kinase DegS
MKRLSKVIEKTLKAVEDGKEEIFNIYEATKHEVQRLENELTYLSQELNEIFVKVERQQKLVKASRQRLMIVNRDFRNYSEKQKIEAYAQANNAQAELKLLEDKELQLRSRRDEIERSLKNLKGTVQKAENLISQISLAITFLKEGITEISNLYNPDQKTEVAIRILKAQEEERRRLAREVHDGPAQSLANIVLRLEIAEKLLELDHRKVKQELKELNSLVRKNLKDIRRIIFDLRPLIPENASLKEIIENYSKQYEKTHGILCKLNFKGQEKEPNPILKLALLQIIQEGMINVAKHAQAQECIVNLEFQEQFIEGKIIDEGQGFNPEETLKNPGEHFGLIGVAERIEMFSVTFSLKSAPGKGTIFQFGLPYTK